MQKALKNYDKFTACGAIKNIYIQECFDEFNEEWIEELFPNYEKVKDGHLTIPDRPGLGISINESVVKITLYNKSNFLRMFSLDGKIEKELVVQNKFKIEPNSFTVNFIIWLIF